MQEHLRSSGKTTGDNLPLFITNYDSTHILNTRQFATNVKNYILTEFEPDNLKNMMDVTVNPYYLFPDNGGIPLGNIRLSGDITHDQIPIALLGAGLIGLPFLRRLKKYMID
jgi:hypothetical protein